MNLTRDELQVLLWACEHEILRLPSERNEQQTLALLSATTKVREAYRRSGEPAHEEGTSVECGSMWLSWRCVLPVGHDGDCHDEGGFTKWPRARRA